MMEDLIFMEFAFVNSKGELCVLMGENMFYVEGVEHLVDSLYFFAVFVKTS